MEALGVRNCSQSRMVRTQPHNGCDGEDLLGDGFSCMSARYSCGQRYDLPLKVSPQGYCPCHDQGDEIDWHGEPSHQGHTTSAAGRSSTKAEVQTPHDIDCFNSESSLNLIAYRSRYRPVDGKVYRSCQARRQS